MRIAILTFDGFNETDSFVALNMLGRVKPGDWQVAITSPSQSVQSQNGVMIRAQQPLEFANDAEVVLVGSGRHTRRVVHDTAVMSRLRLDSKRQLIGSQCSGALLLAKLRLPGSGLLCTDDSTRPALQSEGVTVPDQPFYSVGNIASAGGCLSSHYLATWVVWRLEGKAAAEKALAYVAPVGEKERYVAHALKVVEPFVEASGEIIHTTA